MIVVTASNGHLIKVLGKVESGTFGFHNLFGLLDINNIQRKLAQRKKKGLPYKDSRFKCLFSLSSSENSGLTIQAQKNCSVEKINDNEWKLVTSQGDYFVKQGVVDHTLSEGDDVIHEGVNDLVKAMAISIIFFLALFGVLYALIPTVEEEPKKEELDVKEVKIDQKTVTIRAPIQKVKTQLTKKQKAHRAIKQNLGFLGMLGNKNLKKAVGGAPTELKNASAGAGAGTAGSGGELLVGLGKGVKKTTVGNTGVAGLGGVGTKGAGGGQGGYGTVSVGSGEGKGISSIAVSQDMVLEGGLSRYVVQATIAKYLSQVRACYEEGLQRNPGLKGTVDVAFTIRGNGKVKSSRVRKSSLGDKKVEKCITTKMRGWNFPKPRGGVDVNVNYPFLLRPVRS